MQPTFDIKAKLLFCTMMLETLVFAVLCALLTVVAPAPRPTAALVRTVAPVEVTATPESAATDLRAALSVGADLNPSEPTATDTVMPTATAVPGGDADARGPGVIAGIVYDSQDDRSVSNARIEFVGFGTPVTTSASRHYGKRDLTGGQTRCGSATKLHSGGRNDRDWPPGVGQGA